MTAVGTAGRILQHARRAFNAAGVGQIGIRELARELDLSPGNVSYHFPTKEALILALVEEMHAANNAAVASPPPGPPDFAGVDAIIREIMRRDLENAWLMRDLVSLLHAVPALRRLHRPMQQAREGRVDTLVERLASAGLLDRGRTERALPRLRQQLITQVMFWLPSAIVAAPEADPALRLDAHARLVMALFEPFCTARGKRQLAPLL